MQACLSITIHEVVDQFSRASPRQLNQRGRLKCAGDRKCGTGQ